MPLAYIHWHLSPYTSTHQDPPVSLEYFVHLSPLPLSQAAQIFPAVISSACSLNILPIHQGRPRESNDSMVSPFKQHSMETVLKYSYTTYKLWSSKGNPSSPPHGERHHGLKVTSVVLELCDLGSSSGSVPWSIWPLKAIFSFSYLDNESNNSIYIIQLLWYISDLLYMQFIQININYLSYEKFSFTWTILCTACKNL